jgi:hypothetical protein
LRTEAERNNPVAQCALGSRYYNGEGVVSDKAEAVKWFRKAAEQGFAQAQYNLGVCYANGEGIAQDKAEGERLPKGGRTRRRQIYCSPVMSKELNDFRQVKCEFRKMWANRDLSRGLSMTIRRSSRNGRFRSPFPDILNKTAAPFWKTLPSRSHKMVS